MHTIQSHGTTISYEKHGSGPPLVLVHGAFSDHRTNWEFVLDRLSSEFTVWAVARRGRGITTSTESHTLEDESRDIAAVLRAVQEPAVLLGHSYGAHVALGSALIHPARVRKLILYEAPWPGILHRAMLDLERLAAARDWDGFSYHFFREVLTVPAAEMDALRAGELWPPILADAPATLGDLRALSRYDFDPLRFARLSMPVLLQTGSDSPAHFYITSALAALLPNACVECLEAQAHEAMTTAPALYAASVINFAEEPLPA